MGEIWAPNSRAFHAVGGPFTLWEVLFTEIHGDSRVIFALPGFGAESKAIQTYQISFVYVMFTVFFTCYALCFV